MFIFMIYKNGNFHQGGCRFCVFFDTFKDYRFIPYQRNLLIIVYEISPFVFFLFPCNCIYC
jgi:hypothetical protein